MPSRSSDKTAADRPGRVVIVLNATAGRGRARRLWNRLQPELDAWRRAPEITETQHPGHGAELARRAVAAGADLVIAAGGDGTAHDVVQGLMEAEATGSGTAFAHLPLGTGCDLARGLGLSTPPTGVLRRLEQGRTIHLDIGVADLAAGNDTVRRYFFNVANVGLGPLVARRVMRSGLLQRFGKHAYTLASLREIAGARPHAVAWRTDTGQSGQSALLQMFICNGPSVAGGMRPAPGASFDNGELHIVIAGELGFFAALSEFRKLDRGIPFSHPAIESFACRSIELTGPGLEVETDGEIAGGLPARLQVRPGGLLTRMPA